MCNKCCKKIRVAKEYRDFLKEYRSYTSPVSKEMMAEALSFRFNLSPEYSRKLVYSLYE